MRSLLLWVGAALLAASALTFTAVAWAHLGDGGRALLLVGVTVLSVGSALGLARRLPATAEAFTALSIALALIDWLALRRAGIAVRFLGQAKKDKVFKYSTAAGLPRVVIVGEEEAASGVYALRDGETRQERKLTEAELIAALTRAQ